MGFKVRQVGSDVAMMGARAAVKTVADASAKHSNAPSALGGTSQGWRRA